MSRHYGYGAPGLPMVPAGGPNMPPVPMEQPKSLFRYGEQSLWSSRMHVGGAALANGSFRLFSTALGRTGQGFTAPMTIAETNIKESGRIPNGVAFDCFGLAAQFYKADGVADGGDITVAVNDTADVDELINTQYNCALSWDFTQTQVDIAPFDLVGAGGGAFGAISTTVNASSMGAMSNGNGSVWLYRKHPVALPAATTFGILLRYGSRAAVVGTNSQVIRVVLFGYYKNVIEIG
jgi:hypothetical protein